MSRLKFPPPTGIVARGFENVFKVFSENYANGIEKGSSFAAYYRGQPVVNIWGGLSDWEVKRAWKEDTMGLFHSTAKIMAAIVIAHLVERNLLKYEEKISRCWPEFAQNEKENITVEQLLSYRGGLAALSSNFYLRWMRDDPQKLYNLLIEQKPLWPPGTSNGYHPHTVGLYLNEIVKRVDKKGRNLSQYFHDEIASPFGIDFYIGVPKTLYHRVARLEPIILNKEEEMLRFSTFKGNAKLFQMAFSQIKDWCSSRILNDPDFLELPSPSSHGAGTAVAVAKVMGILANGGEHEGKVLLSPESIKRLQEPLSHGTDLTIGTDDINGRGTWLIPVVEGDQTWYMYGHSGYGDQIGAADPHYRTGFAYTTNHIHPNITLTKENKWKPLVEALFQCIHKLEGVKVERKMLNSMEELEKEKQRKRHQSKL